MRQIVFLKNPLGLKVSYKNKTLRQTLVKKLECNLVTWSLRQFSLYNTVSVIPAVWWMIDWSRSSKTSASINLYHRLGFIIASFRVTSHSYHHVTYLFKTNQFVWCLKSSLIPSRITRSDWRFRSDLPSCRALQYKDLDSSWKLCTNCPWSWWHEESRLWSNPYV